jgi:group I intron endonuclease
MPYKKVSGVYCIENIENGKRYIGKGNNIRRRLAEHKKDLRKNNHKNDHLQKSWNKYGETHFIFYILEYCSCEETSQWEKYWIKELKTFGYRGDFGYNLTEGGEGSVGYKHSEEIKRKMSENHYDCSGKNGSFYNKHHSEETKKIISEKHIGINLGVPRTQETKNKISESKKGVSKPKFTDEWIENMRKAHIGMKTLNATSKYFGVSFYKRDGKWICYIKINRKTKNLGLYVLEIDAAKAWDKYVIENKLNQPLNFPLTLLKGD